MYTFDGTMITENLSNYSILLKEHFMIVFPSPATTARTSGYKRAMFRKYLLISSYILLVLLLCFMLNEN